MRRRIVRGLLHRLKTPRRTFNIARRDKRIGIALLLLYFFSLSVGSYYTDVLSFLLFTFRRSGSPIYFTGPVSSG